MTLLGTLAAQADPEINSFQAGSGAFWTFVALGAVLVVLVLNMRRQFRRIDFDASGTTDAERMGGAAARRTDGPAQPDEDRPTG
jgi:hypothetical protein